MNDYYVYLVPAMGLIGLLYTLWKFFWVSKQDAGTDRMKEISTYIAEGAMAFLSAEYRLLLKKILSRKVMRLRIWKKFTKYVFFIPIY